MTHGATTRTAVIRPLQRPVPLRQSVYDALIDLIVSGELPPGQHMVETDLARQLGVSRQPIREALHRMEAEGWVDLRPSQGAFVHVPTGSEVNELLDVRALLEAETARLAARAASPAQVARLREICAAGQAAAEADDLSQAVGRPVTDRTLGQAAERMGVTVRDNLGRVAIPIETYEQMKASYVSTGYYGPRRRGASPP